MNRYIKRQSSLEKGQMLLIVILVMVVALTIGLSIVTRTITNVRTTGEEESSQRAFSAAEAGVEKELSMITGSNYNPGTISGSFSTNAKFTSTTSPYAGTQFLLNNGSPIAKDDGVDIWLSTYPSYNNQWGGQLTFYWGTTTDNCTTNEATNTMAAIEIITITGSLANPLISHYTSDPCAARRAYNNFDSTNLNSSVVNGKTFGYQRTITIPPNSGLVARIVPIYAGTVMGVSGDSLLPSQGTLITSIGTSDATQRKIVTFRSYPRLPIELFPYVLFSPCSSSVSVNCP